MTDTVHRPEPPAPRPPTDPRGELASSPTRVALIAVATVLFGLWAGVGWLVVILALMVMIFLHELGHFLTAKWSGMKATEFFIGAGPRIWSFRRGETEYGFKAIPVLAYVRIIGMNNLDEVAPEDEPRTYRQQSFPKRFLVATAGSGMHFLQAFVLFALVFAVFGVPASNVYADRIGDGIDESDWIVGEVVDRSAAERAGLEVGDDIVSIAGEPVTEFADIGPLVTDRAGDDVPIVIERDGREQTVTATIGQNENDPDLGFLGVGGDYPDAPDVQVGPLAAVGHAAEETVAGIGLSIQGMTQFFTGGLDDFADQVVNAGDADEPSAAAAPAGRRARSTRTRTASSPSTAWAVCSKT